MSPQQAAAITNNEKVFPIFAKKLSTDDEGTFCHTAGKLSMWLSSEKAYYTAARPKVSHFIRCFITHYEVRRLDREVTRGKD